MMINNRFRQSCRAPRALFFVLCSLCFSVALVSLTGCDSKTVAPKGYTITGTAEGTQDGDTVYLCEMQGFFAMNPLDSAYVKGGKFEFKGEAEGAALRFLVPLHGGKPTAMTMFVLENANIKATIKSQDEQSVITGGENQKLYDEYLAGDKKFSEQMEQPWNTINDSTADKAAKEAAQQVMDSLQKEQAKYHKEFIISHVPSAFSDMIYAYCMQEFTEAEQEEILKLFGEKQPDYPVYKAIMAEREAMKASTVGAEYTDLEMADPTGKTIRVSDYVGKSKFVLVDFWASWCGPCRAEMPTVVKAYTDYHAKGFEVVGVSLDNNKDAWVKAIDQLKMPWPQMSDLKGWESVGAQKYNVRSIPANILIDQQGKIIAKDLRGEDLLSKLADLMKD